jgi:hypothetical protein
MWEFTPPPHPGDGHFDLGIWHPSALPADKWNKAGYLALEQLSELDNESWICEDEHAVPGEPERAVQAFENDVCAVVDTLPDEQLCSRPWTIVIRRDPTFSLISLWPTAAPQLAPAIVEVAKRHGLVCYDPQNDVVAVRPIF